MARRAERCVMISVCLLLLPLCWGVEPDHEYEYEFTDTPEFDYNTTFEYSFFSNVSSEDLEKFLKGEELYTEGETSFTESETDGRVHQEKPTEPPVMFESQASRSSPACLLLTLVVMVHHLLRLL
ncbi:uncharacterized protein isoform X1 [Danio rerio]|nr:uncharacterized protein LOC564095 precursor [Danio rerio]AAI34077.1 Si:ch211-191i18.2 protein [Danio rerio]|eukprot:NP_001038506.1 uncharacterized protein LOC564095 precursor [Danio rerio]